jgi:hypothetical protein
MYVIFSIADRHRCHFTRYVSAFILYYTSSTLYLCASRYFSKTMPVSHIGLTVSHIPSATSFYLAALQPLGYRFIGHQSDSIGFGIEPADFFLSQSAKGYV